MEQNIILQKIFMSDFDMIFILKNKNRYRNSKNASFYNIL